MKTQILKSLVLIGFTSIALFAPEAKAQWSLDLNKGSGSVDFHAVGKPKMLKIHGKGEKATGILTVDGSKVSGKAIFDLTTLETGISMRDNHMKEKYLEVEKYPKAELEILAIKLPKEFAADFEGDVPFKGKLTLRGASQNVTGIAKLKKSAGRLSGQVEFKTKVQGYNIDIPSFAGITMADEVEVKVEFEGALNKTGSKVAKN